MERDSTDDFESRSVTEYLAELAGGAPAPGGGSAAGLAGAMGCCLGEMVCQLTLARGASIDVEQLAARFADHRGKLLNLAVQDEHAFASYRLAVGLPKTNDQEKADRRTAMASALVEAATVPLEMIHVGLSSLDLLDAAATVGTPHALGDLKTGGFLLQAMILGSLVNIDANARMMKDDKQKVHFIRAADSARHHLDARMMNLSRSVSARAT